MLLLLVEVEIDFVGIFILFSTCTADFVMKIRQSRTVQARLVEMTGVNKKLVGRFGMVLLVDMVIVIVIA